MRRFAGDNGVFVEICGKLVVATDPSQVPALQDLYQRGQANGVPCRDDQCRRGTGVRAAHLRCKPATR